MFGQLLQRLAASLLLAFPFCMAAPGHCSYIVVSLMPSELLAVDDAPAGIMAAAPPEDDDPVSAIARHSQSTLPHGPRATADNRESAGTQSSRRRSTKQRCFVNRVKIAVCFSCTAAMPAQ